ncbi:hypothetical protein KVT40_008523 [Elsinoe batatas]|uniref:Uncharacterized protein n=1 Tax=Elsinoe batatas TaxID=2601811 RepID=A0A8K0KU52_9PEZI|nr:hypothetical protein KVT40_008523 [Elsinoe batatas]
MSTTTTTTEPNATMAATAAATSAASGMNAKAKRPVLQTADSACFPSEIRTPLSATPIELKRQDSGRSPISPPLSYMNFLAQAKSPGGMMSPPNSCGTLSRFPSTDSASDLTQNGAATRAEDDKSATPKQHPPITRNLSTDSSTSSYTCSSAETAPSPPATASSSRRKPMSPRITIPNANSYPRFPRSNSARTPHGSRVPHSPFSANSVRSPMSARSMQSPYATSAQPQTPWSASAASPRVPFSPRNTVSRNNLPPSVVNAIENRQHCRIIKKENYRSTVETTYEILPLEPAPRGKRRKTVSSEEPPQLTPTQESHDAAEARSKSEEMVKGEKVDTEDEGQVQVS